jgi:hypothetical protein
LSPDLSSFSIQDHPEAEMRLSFRQILVVAVRATEVIPAVEEASAPAAFLPLGFGQEPENEARRLLEGAKKRLNIPIGYVHLRKIPVFGPRGFIATSLVLS